MYKEKNLYREGFTHRKIYIWKDLLKKNIHKRDVHRKRYIKKDIYRERFI